MIPCIIPQPRRAGLAQRCHLFQHSQFKGNESCCCRGRRWHGNSCATAGQREQQHQPLLLRENRRTTPKSPWHPLLASPAISPGLRGYSRVRDEEKGFSQHPAGILVREWAGLWGRIEGFEEIGWKTGRERGREIPSAAHRSAVIYGLSQPLPAALTVLGPKCCAILPSLPPTRSWRHFPASLLNATNWKWFKGLKSPGCALAHLLAIFIRPWSLSYRNFELCLTSSESHGWRNRGQGVWICL